MALGSSPTLQTSVVAIKATSAHGNGHSDDQKTMKTILKTDQSSRWHRVTIRKNVHAN